MSKRLRITEITYTKETTIFEKQKGNVLAV